MPNDHVTYCGTRLGWDRDERVLVARGDDVRPLRQRGHANRFTWGYPGGGPIALAVSILCDYLQISEEDSAAVRDLEVGRAWHLANEVLCEMPHCWIMTGSDVAPYAARVMATV
ncbi:MAG TPA: DUF6166 domain-containing protein [Xanthomonadales bacterium]|nr:DUF6166 domain-containing protein [Xanthomonadales bacterium]